jgi:hypothetical protein
VDNGRTDQAFGLYEHIRMQADDPIDQAAAAHNMGVVSELDGRFGDAFEYYADADQLDPANPIIVASLTRVEKQKNRRQRVKARREDAAGQALLVNATPVESRIRIVNIEAAYHDDMLLPPGEYDLQVDAPGYRSHREWVVIEDEDVELDVVLEPKR